MAAEIHDVVAKGSPTDTVEMKVIVEGEHGKCISIEYKGEPGRALDTLTKEAERCLPKIGQSHEASHPRHELPVSEVPEVESSHLDPTNG